MAYAAVKSLVHTIHGLLSSSRISAASTRQNLQSALDHATSLEDQLERWGEWVTEMDEKIIMEESRKLEDAIELHLLSLSRNEDPTFHQLRQYVDCFVNTAKQRERRFEEDEDMLSQEEEEDDDDSSMVGLSDQFLQIRDHLLADGRSKEPAFITSIMIWISGMAGIGKTRLAKELCHDPSVKASFDCRAFVIMGQESKDYKENKIIEVDEDEGFLSLLTQRKSLIVFDDVQEHYDASFDYFHGKKHEYNGSRILVTSRQDADYYTTYSLSVKMRFLNEEESWELLRRKVFVEEEEDCPQQLVKAGKKIAEKCEGLPLLIIKVAPILLSKAQKNPEAWKRVAEKPDPVFSILLLFLRTM